MSEKTIDSWTETQIKYARFLSRGKTTLSGEKRTNEQFAEAIGVGVATLYRWKELEGFMHLVFEMTMKDLVDDLPMMVKSIKAKAVGQTLYYKDRRGKEREAKPDTQAFLAVMRQARLLQSEKIDHTTNGKDMPTPILGGSARDESSN